MKHSFVELVLGITIRSIHIIGDHHLNAVDHVRFRSVCSRWRAATNQRQKGPLVIILHRVGPLNLIASFAFFDMIRKEIIRPRRPFTSSRAHYCGSSHGWFFIAKLGFAGHAPHGLVKEDVRISLLNPFSDQVIRLPLLNGGGRGFVLLSHSPPNLDHNSAMVLYCTRGYQNVATLVSFLRASEHQWTTCTFPPGMNPNDIIAFNGHFFANYGGILYQINPDQVNNLVNFLQPYILPGMHPDHPASHHAHLNHLRFFQDVRGGLHLVCRSNLPGTYCILEVYVGQMGDFNQFTFSPPVHFGSNLVPAMYFNQNHFLIILDLRVHSVDIEALTLHAQDFDPRELLWDLSCWWIVQYPFEEAGWITPDLS